MIRALIWVAVSTKEQAESDHVSLQAQEDQARLVCTREGWQVSEVVRVPGHSRDYIDIFELARDMRLKGIPAFDKLMQGWADNSFDILLVRDGDRFARTQSLFCYIVEKTIVYCGQRIYSIAHSQMIDRENYRFWMTMSGYGAASEIDRLKARHSEGMAKRIQRGLVPGVIPFAYKAIRDDKGKLLRVEVDETKRRLFDDIARLILEDVGWAHIGHELYERFGHVDPQTGKPFKREKLRETIHTAAWWGGISWQAGGDKHKRWTWDENAPVPSGVTVIRNTHEPVWAGELGDKIKAELKRRIDFKATGIHVHTKCFSGLLVCAGCGYTVGADFRIKLNPAWRYWRCHTNTRQYVHPCPSPGMIQEDALIAWLNAELPRVFSLGVTFLSTPFTGPAVSPLNTIEMEIEELTRKAKQYIKLQGQAELSPAMSALYADEIKALDEQMQRLTAAKQNMVFEAQAVEAILRRRSLALEQLAGLGGMEALWKQEEYVIHQLLADLLGTIRIKIGKHKVAGFSD